MNPITYDLYFCTKGVGGMSVIARWGNNPSQYESGLQTAIICLVLAEKKVGGLEIHQLREALVRTMGSKDVPEKYKKKISKEIQKERTRQVGNTTNPFAIKA